ncbi:hypothetical protein [Thermococcus camini]|uniref:Uncharacterized protein n=1 Tax=Thermococcus camini TaxID=2016373 RepID=A0A7G2DC98_9EURY|nr:hypothetical protein [Thermococcus camini]CAD5245185.1 conserved membrane protein of unknown function [Thermococcus camini]
MIEITDKKVTQLLRGDFEDISEVRVENGELKISGELEDSFKLTLSDSHPGIQGISIKATVEEDRDSVVSLSRIPLKEFFVSKLHYCSTERAKFQIGIANINTLDSVILYDINIPLVLNTEYTSIEKFHLENVEVDYIRMDNFNVHAFTLERVTGSGTERRIELLGIENILDNRARSTEIRLKEIKDITAIVLKAEGTSKQSTVPVLGSLTIEEVDAKSVIISGVHIRKFYLESNDLVIDKLILSNVEVDELYISKNGIRTLVIENGRIGRFNVKSKTIEKIYLKDVTGVNLRENQLESSSIILDLTSAYIELKVRNGQIKITELEMGSKLEINSLQCAGDLVFQPKKDIDAVILTDLHVYNVHLFGLENTESVPHIGQLKIQGDLYSGNTTKVQVDINIKDIDIGKLVMFNVDVGNNLQLMGSVNNYSSIFEGFRVERVNIGNDFKIVNYNICPKEDCLNREVKVSKIYVGKDILFGTVDNAGNERIGLPHNTPAWIRASMYRLARRNYDSNGNPEKADEYFVLEMRSRREDNRAKSRTSGSMWKKIMGELAYLGEKIFIDIFSEYGTNWKRTFGVWLGIWLIGAILYGIYDLFGLLSSESVHSIVGYMYISLSALVTSDPYVVFSTRFAIWTYAIEMGLGIYIWTQLLALFSRQFMRGA